MFETPHVHPGVFLFANLSLAAFMLGLPTQAWRAAGLVWAGCAVLGAFGSPRFTTVIKRMGFTLPFLIFSMFFHLFFTPGTFWFSLGPLHATLDGLRQGAWITQKLAFFFWVSLIVTASRFGLFPFQALERASRLPLLKKTRMRLGIIVLFLILRWLRVLPLSWKRQLQALLKESEGKFEKTRKGLRHLPRILGHDLIHLDTWVTLFIARGYEEGILRLAETPIPPLTRTDLLILTGTCAAWGIFFASFIFRT